MKSVGSQNRPEREKEGNKGRTGDQLKNGLLSRLVGRKKRVFFINVALFQQNQSSFLGFTTVIQALIFRKLF